MVPCVCMCVLYVYMCVHLVTRMYMHTCTCRNQGLMLDIFHFLTALFLWDRVSWNPKLTLLDLFVSEWASGILLLLFFHSTGVTGICTVTHSSLHCCRGSELSSSYSHINNYYLLRHLPSFNLTANFIVYIGIFTMALWNTSSGVITTMKQMNTSVIS